MFSYSYVQFIVFSNKRKAKNITCCILSLPKVAFKRHILHFCLEMKGTKMSCVSLTNTLYDTGAQLDKKPKLHQKLIQNTLEIDFSFLLQFVKFWVYTTFNDRKRKLCESAKTCLILFWEIISSELIFGGFEPFETTVGHRLKFMLYRMRKCRLSRRNICL